MGLYRGSIGVFKGAKELGIWESGPASWDLYLVGSAVQALGA